MFGSMDVVRPGAYMVRAGFEHESIVVDNLDIGRGLEKMALKCLFKLRQTC